MAYIPPNKEPFPTFSSGQAEDTAADSQQDEDKSKISSVSLPVLANIPASIASQSGGFAVTIKSRDEKPFQFVPWPDTPSILFQNQDFGLKNLFLINLKILKAPYPLQLLQSFISQIESVDTLLEIWTELIKKPEDESLEVLLVNVFQAIYEKDIDSSFTAYTKTGQRLEIKKRLADCIRPDNYEFFLDKFIEKNAPFSIALFSKKVYDKCMMEVDAKCISDRTWRYLEFEMPPLSEAERICHALYMIYRTKPLGQLKGLTLDKFQYTLDKFQYLCFYFFEAGWGTKEEFLTKALCSFWNEITSTKSKEIKTCLGNLENGILDIGYLQDSNLTSGNIPHFVLLFSLGILFPTIQKKICDRGTSPFPVEPVELESDYARLDLDTSRFIDKIRTLLLPPEEAIKNLKEVNQSNPESFPCIRAKHPQFSGSCTVKNLNSLLSMSSTAPSIIMHGGFKGHSVYAEVFKSGDKYYALVHNLGAGSHIHQKHHGNKIIPLALCFQDKENLIEFSKIFCKEETTEPEYLALVKRHMFETDPKLALPFVGSLSFIDSSRTNPMYPEYRKFRELQKEMIGKLFNPTGSPSEEKRKASDVRKTQKGRARGGQ